MEEGRISLFQTNKTDSLSSIDFLGRWMGVYGDKERSSHNKRFNTQGNFFKSHECVSNNMVTKKIHEAKLTSTRRKKNLPFKADDFHMSLIDCNGLNSSPQKDMFMS